MKLCFVNVALNTKNNQSFVSGGEYREFESTEQHLLRTDWLTYLNTRNEALLRQRRIEHKK